MKRYALIDRHGDDGGRYLPSQHKQMKQRAWALAQQTGNVVQVWACYGEQPDKYDSAATQRVTNYIVAARDFLDKARDAQ